MYKSPSMLFLPMSVTAPRALCRCGFSVHRRKTSSHGNAMSGYHGKTQAFAMIFLPIFFTERSGSLHDQWVSTPSPAARGVDVFRLSRTFPHLGLPQKLHYLHSLSKNNRAHVH